MTKKNNKQLMVKLEKVNRNIENDTISAMKSFGRSKHPEDINVLDIYYNEYLKAPSLFRFETPENGYFYWDVLLENIHDLYPDMKEYFKDEVRSLEKDLKYTKQQTLKLRDGILLQVEGSLIRDLFIETKNMNEMDNVVSYSTFLVDDSMTQEEEDLLHTAFKNAIVVAKETVSIGMVSHENGDFYVKDFDITDKINDLKSLDLHYGKGFEEFNEKLFERLLNEEKGLTLFHGEPGTGKTTYIRDLVKRLKLNNKDNNILYFPPTMVDSITDPSFINFISDWVMDSKGKNYLLIEDAEPLLESRNSSRNIGITNLLNLTDGLLNDVLRIQIIATFNTKLSNIDSALLRPERLLARKEFTCLSDEDAETLCAEIGVDKNLLDKDTSLASIYALKKDTKPLMHSIEQSGSKLGF